MKHRLAIEPNLTPIKDFLKDKGYQIESMTGEKGNTNNKGRFDAYIVTGLSTDLLGIHDTETRAVVINAKGLTPEQVYHELQMRLES